MALESALLKQLLSHGDFDTWNDLRPHYFPEGDYRKIYTLVDKHVQRFQSLPTFEDVEEEFRSRELREKFHAIKAVETDVPAYQLLEYLKDQYAQAEILHRLEYFLDNKITIADAKENIDFLQELVINLEDRVDISTESEPMDSVELFDSQEDLYKYLPLGLNSEYDMRHTFSPKDLVVVGASSGQGKSFTCCNIAANARAAGKTVLYFTIEMDTRPILQRIGAISTGIGLNALRAGNLNTKDWKKVAQWWSDRFEGGDEIYKEYESRWVPLAESLPIFEEFHNKLRRKKLTKTNQLEVYYDSGLTMAKIASVVRQKRLEYEDLGLIVVDYLNQVRRHNAPSRSGQYEWTEQIEISKALKALAQENNCMVLSAFQTDVKGEARFAKGILDAVDAAYVIQQWGKEVPCIKFTNKKMRSGEQEGFISHLDWDSWRIGPESGYDPDAQGMDSSEEVDDL